MDVAERIRRKNEFDASLVYGTRNFNLLTGRDAYAKYRNRVDSSWIDPKSGKLDERLIEPRDCPVCGRSDYSSVFEKCAFAHVRCCGCGLLYVNPILNSSESSKAYDKEGIYERVLESKEQLRMNTLEFNYYLDVIGMYLDQRRDIKVCDIGCGPGDLLHEAKKRGFYVLGIEPHEASHQALNEKGIDYISDFFPLKSDLGIKFDCVFLINTLEHLRNPGETLTVIAKMLNEGGLFYTSTPNLGAFVNRILHEKAGAFGGHTHLQIFDKRTLTLLLERNGFGVVDCETIITEIGAIKNYLSYKDPYFGEDADESALEFLTPAAIYKYDLGRSLNILARVK